VVQAPFLFGQSETQSLMFSPYLGYVPEKFDVYN